MQAGRCGSLLLAKLQGGKAQFTHPPIRSHPNRHWQALTPSLAGSSQRQSVITGLPNIARQRWNL